MFALTVRDHFMIAHSFRGAVFGPAQQLHGATYVVDVELRRPNLDENGLVTDIGLLSALVKEVLSALTYRNLDDDPAFADRNTTTEFLAKVVFDRLEREIADGRLGPDGDGIAAMKVTLAESHIAWASYEAPLGGPLTSNGGIGL